MGYLKNIPSYKVVLRKSYPTKKSHPIPVLYHYKDMVSRPNLPILSSVGYPVGYPICFRPVSRCTNSFYTKKG